MDIVFGDIYSFLPGLLIGFIIGLERERAHEPETQPLGVRTFAFLGLLGAFAGYVETEAVAAILFLFVCLAVLIGYVRSTQQQRKSDIGLTTEIAAVVVFGLGYIGVQESANAFILAALTLGLLAGRKSLHDFTREKITQQEAQAFITLIVLGVAILPFLSPQPVDPWGIFVPLKLGTLVFLLALIQFLSYALLKTFGHKAGAVLGGFLAGMASSTAAFVNIRQQLNRKDVPATTGLLVYGMMAILGSALQAAMIIFANSKELMGSLAWSFGAIFIFCLVMALLSFFVPAADEMGQKILADGPLNLKKQASFALILFLVTAMTNLAKYFIGTTAFLAVSFVSGLFELQGVTFAISSMPFHEQVVWAATLAFLGSLVSKSFVIFSASGSKLKSKFLIIGSLLLLGVLFVVPLIVTT